MLGHEPKKSRIEPSNRRLTGENDRCNALAVLFLTTKAPRAAVAVAGPGQLVDRGHRIGYAGQRFDRGGLGDHEVVEYQASRLK